ncbi:protein-S-isoprenylcysteine O-methyltransferase Ste14 [Catenuloplanes nepalensis]|uniref:Protein-S-isoprenylcysteine O-methyltransferase Ste14 n=1 Tax=Catenuloplanes nepalensis TaxID=587533 RepID=A0ABT9N162_9ACTN|nr:hypothetical protein [Catenuloplanes nepalensis]MDP9797429.1 protein-S-isoprenylcysteine O-methyltransferase Ste14 [Catenuloplanes nepalensis]
MFFFAAVTSLPMLIAAVAGLALVRARARSLPARSARFATIGLALVLASTVLGMIWQIATPGVLEAVGTSLFGLYSFGQWIVTGGLSVAGLALLIAAVLARATPRNPWEAVDQGPRPPFIQ